MRNNKVLFEKTHSLDVFVPTSQIIPCLRQQVKPYGCTDYGAFCPLSANRPPEGAGDPQDSQPRSCLETGFVFSNPNAHRSGRAAIRSVSFPRRRESRISRLGASISRPKPLKLTPFGVAQDELRYSCFGFPANGRLWFGFLKLRIAARPDSLLSWQPTPVILISC